MKRCRRWRNWCLSAWTYLHISSDCSTKGKPWQVGIKPAWTGFETRSRIQETMTPLGLPWDRLQNGSAWIWLKYTLIAYTVVFADEYRLSDYAIGPEAKLNLVVRPTGERNSGPTVSSNSTTTTSCSSNSGNTGSGVWQLLSTVLAKHFSPADAAKVQEQLIKVLSLRHLVCSCTFNNNKHIMLH